MSFKFPIRVYIEDTDIGGIVYYVNYLKFMERARTEFLRSFNIEQNELKQLGLLFVVKSVDCDYKAPAKLDDQLFVSVDIVACGAAGVTFKQKVIIEDKILCEAVIKVVCVDSDKLKPTRLPTDIKEHLLGSKP